VQFNASGSTDPNPGDFILGYDWDFGDGSPRANSNAPQHTYSAAGTYTVTLRVMDNHDSYSNPVTTTITATSGGTQTGTLASWDFRTRGGQASVATTTALSGVSATAPSLVASIGPGLSAVNYLGNGPDGQQPDGYFAGWSHQRQRLHFVYCCAYVGQNPFGELR
jgi:PKD repeat protein